MTSSSEEQLYGAYSERSNNLYGHKVYKSIPDGSYVAVTYIFSAKSEEEAKVILNDTYNFGDKQFVGKIGEFVMNLPNPFSSKPCECINIATLHS
jgi:hypothetical protein